MGKYLTPCQWGNVLGGVAYNSMLYNSTYVRTYVRPYAHGHLNFTMTMAFAHFRSLEESKESVLVLCVSASLEVAT